MAEEKIIELKTIKESPKDFEEIEKKIKELFKKEIYFPLLAELSVPRGTIQNENDALIEAIRSGRITFNRGTFSGKFNATISKQLKDLGATWDRKGAAWKISERALPMDLRAAISASAFKFQEKMNKIDQRLAEILPDELADKLKVSQSFESTLGKTDKSFRDSVKRFTVSPKLSDAQKKKIADEWQNNMRLWIKDFTKEEISRLREEMQKSVLSGNRYDAAIKSIQKSYGVSANKAKFLAKQETSLLMAKHKETRYQDVGLDEYHWYHVVGTAAHPVRPFHKALGDAREKDGSKKVYRFSNPPIVDKDGNKKNPGEDYNCRCTARVIVRFK